MNKLLNYINKYSQKLLWLFIFLYIVIFSAVCLWKYSNFLYDGLDLAIINNVFYNTAHGNWFWSSIQGHSYLGDHFTPILILLLPIYLLWQSPQVLLILQSIFLGLTAWPIYKIALMVLAPSLSRATPSLSRGSRLPAGEAGGNPSQDALIAGSRRSPLKPLRSERIAHDDSRVFALLITILWLINPLVHNINLYEFHFIALAPLLLLMAFYYYLKIRSSEEPSKKLLLYFYIFIFLSLLVREDVAFVILIFGIIALFDLRITRLAGRQITNNSRRHLLLVVGCWLLAVIYLLLANILINKFSPSSFSPFFYYYMWLGNASFAQVIKHLITYANFEMLVGFLLPFLFMPLLKPKWLFLAIAPLAQIIFSAAGGGALVWQMHYGALFLPGLMMAFIYAFNKANNFMAYKFKSKYLLLIILLVTNIYLWMDFGTLGKSCQITKKSPDLGVIENDAVVMASFNYLANLSSRENIYALHYYFLGVEQFAQADYILAQEPKYILLDKDDYKYYDEILKTSAWAAIYYKRGYQRLEELFSLYQVVEIQEQVSLLKKI